MGLDIFVVQANSWEEYDILLKKLREVDEMLEKDRKNEEIRSLRVEIVDEIQAFCNENVRHADKEWLERTDDIVAYLYEDAGYIARGCMLNNDLGLDIHDLLNTEGGNEYAKQDWARVKKKSEEYLKDYLEYVEKEGCGIDGNIPAVIERLIRIAGWVLETGHPDRYRIDYNY